MSKKNMGKTSAKKSLVRSITEAVRNYKNRCSENFEKFW